MSNELNKRMSSELVVYNNTYGYHISYRIEDEDGVYEGAPLGEMWNRHTHPNLHFVSQYVKKNCKEKIDGVQPYSWNSKEDAEEALQLAIYADRIKGERSFEEWSKIAIEDGWIAPTVESKMKFEVGQKVIAHKFESNEDAEWMSVKARHIGVQGEIVEVYSNSGCLVQFYDGTRAAWRQDALTPIEKEKNEEPVNLTDDDKVRGYRKLEAYQHIEKSTDEEDDDSDESVGYFRAQRDEWENCVKLARKELDKLEGMITVDDEIRW